MAITVLFITATIAITTNIENLMEVLMGITAIVAIRANMAITGMIAITAIIIILVIVIIVSYKANCDPVFPSNGAHTHPRTPAEVMLTPC